MRPFIVYFELFGKKMKVEIMAESGDDAKEKVRRKIKFHKVIERKDNPVVDYLMNIFNNGKQ